MDDQFMQMFKSVRDKIMGPLRVSSGSWCNHLNDQVSATKK